MRYRINQIRLGINEETADFAEAIRKKLRKPDLAVSDIEIIKESVDARRKPDVKLVYTLDFSCDEKLKLEKSEKKVYEPVTVKSEASAAKRRPPVVAGFGPCGMFAALILAEAGLRPVVIERGQAVDERIASVNRFWNEGVLDPESNVQFGEGGAGTFSDGKLTTGIKDIEGDGRVRLGGRGSVDKIQAEAAHRYGQAPRYREEHKAQDRRTWRQSDF